MPTALQILPHFQDIAKENLELETKLRKENFLFKKQLEDFQKDLLEVETDLLTGNINRRARATKNIVRCLPTLPASNALLKMRILGTASKLHCMYSVISGL